MLKSKWKVLWGVFLCLLFGFLCSRYGVQPSPVPTPTASRSIISTTLPLREVWRRTGVLLRYHGLGPPFLSAAEGTLFFVDHSQGWLEGRLQVLDATTGQLLWQTDDIASTPEHSFAASQGRLFIAVDWNIRAYALSDGKLLWRTPGRLPEHTGYDLYPEADKVIVYSTEDSAWKQQDVLSTYDAQTGELLEQVKMETTDARLLWRTARVDYRDDCERLLAIDRASGNTMWQVAIKDCVEFWPSSMGSEKILSTRAGELFAVDIVTGKVKWHYSEKCLSNAGVMDGIVYAIREDGALVGVHQETGREIGTIKFSLVGAEASAYWVATDGKRIFAYFGDSQELIALGS